MTSTPTRRKWIIATTGLTLVCTVVLGFWLWSGFGYITTDDARIKANIVAISSETAGRIEKMVKDEGDHVEPGEVMVELDKREILIQIEQAEAAADRAQSQLLQVEREVRYQRERQRREMVESEAALAGYQHTLEDAAALLAQAKSDWQRAKKLQDKDLVSAQELAHAATEHRQAQARVAALKEKIKEGQATLSLVEIKASEVGIKEADLLAKKALVREVDAQRRDLRHQLSLMTIRSPVRGVVVKKNSNPGEVVQAGQSMFMVVDSTRYWVEANVEETQIRFIRPGSKALVRLDSYPGVQFKGEVVEVGGATTSEFSLFSPQKLTGVFIKTTQKLPVKISVEGHEGMLRVGMLAVVRIEKPEAQEGGVLASSKSSEPWRRARPQSDVR
jgi:membrane fusion protein (multidrug efflux system)